MTPLDIRPLVGKLNDQSRRALEGAAGLTLSRSTTTSKSSIG